MNTDHLVKQERDTRELVRALDQIPLTRENYEQIMGVLIQCKLNTKALESQRDEALGPAKETVSRIRGYFDEPLTALEDAEAVIKEKALELDRSIDEERRKAAEAGQQPAGLLPSVAGISWRESWDFKVINKGMLDPKYLQPDEKAIRAAMKASLDGNEQPAPIPGVKFVRKRTIAVTTPKPRQ